MITGKKYLIYNKVAIIGLGYVGLPLALQFAKKKFQVTAYDVNKKKILILKKKINPINDIKIPNNINFTNNTTDLEGSSFFIITVPTPITKTKKPDLSALKSATELVGKKIKRSSIVVYESTVYPGCTENFCVPILEKLSKMKLNKSFYCGYSPERINPEDKKKTIDKIVKVTSGSNNFSAGVIDFVYKKAIPAGTHKAKSIKIAESAKVIENIQRDLNIALVNELSLIFDKMNLNIHDILETASTKWNFMNFKPGLVGGHCIGIDPYYLTYKSQQLNYNPKVILAGRKINDQMPAEIMKKVLKYFRKKNQSHKQKKIIILGYSFKENSRDIRNSKVLELYRLIKKKCKKVDIFDPIVNVKEILKEHKIKLIKNIKKKYYYDAVILAVPHDEIIKLGKKNIINLAKKDALIIDIKNAL